MSDVLVLYIFAFHYTKKRNKGTSTAMSSLSDDQLMDIFHRYIGNYLIMTYDTVVVIYSNTKR
jgi:hypothetical protein